jgi:hypothetical protein
MDRRLAARQDLGIGRGGGRRGAQSKLKPRDERKIQERDRVFRNVPNIQPTPTG